MFDDIRRIVYDVLDENNIKHIPIEEYLLPVRIRESGKKYINECLNVLSKDRLKEANKHFEEIKHETGKALYYYSLKNDGILKQENLEYFVKKNIENTYYDLKENKYLTKKEWNGNKFVWNTDNINERVCLFYKKIILEDDVLYPVVSYISQKLYEDNNFKINGKPLKEYFNFDKKKRKKVYKSEDKKTLTISEMFILDNLNKICEENKHDKMNLEGIVYYAYNEYYSIENTYLKIESIIFDCKKYIENEIRRILEDCNCKNINFSKEKMAVVINNLDYNLMSNKLITEWMDNRLENWLYEISQ